MPAPLWVLNEWDLLCSTGWCSVFTNYVPRSPDILLSQLIATLLETNSGHCSSAVYSLRSGRDFPKGNLTEPKGKTNQMLSASRIYCEFKMLKWTWTLQNWPVFSSLPTSARCPLRSVGSGSFPYTWWLYSLSVGSSIQPAQVILPETWVLYPHRSMRRFPEYKSKVSPNELNPLHLPSSLHNMG